MLESELLGLPEVLEEGIAIVRQEEERPGYSVVETIVNEIMLSQCASVGEDDVRTGGSDGKPEI